MGIILHYLLGVVVFLLGMWLAQYAAIYSVEVFSKKEPDFSINPGMWLIVILAYGLICWSFIIFGCSFLLSFLIVTPIILSGVFFINGLVASESSKVDKVIGISLFVLIILSFIFLHYYYTTTTPGIEEEVDKSLGIK